MIYSSVLLYIFLNTLHRSAYAPTPTLVQFSKLIGSFELLSIPLKLNNWTTRKIIFGKIYVLIAVVRRTLIKFTGWRNRKQMHGNGGGGTSPALHAWDFRQCHIVTRQICFPRKLLYRECHNEIISGCRHCQVPIPDPTASQNAFCCCGQLYLIN